MKKPKKQQNKRSKAKKSPKRATLTVKKAKAKKVKKVAKKAVKVSVRKKATKITHKKTARKKIKKTVAATRSKKKIFDISRGRIKKSKIRILALVLVIIFLETFIAIPNYIVKLPEEKNTYVPVATAVKNNELENQIRAMVKGYPIENMTPYIASKDREVAAYLVSIAKKESNWGKRRPVLNGQDCYNYWGFRLKSEKMGSGGHTCFDSPQQAVDTIAERIDQLVNEEELKTPKEMVVWKCGYKCNGPEAAGAQKWIKDVNYYYSAFIN